MSAPVLCLGNDVVDDVDEDHDHRDPQKGTTCEEMTSDVISSHVVPFEDKVFSFVRSKRLISHILVFVILLCLEEGRSLPNRSWMSSRAPSTAIGVDQGCFSSLRNANECDAFSERPICRRSFECLRWYREIVADGEICARGAEQCAFVTEVGITSVSSVEPELGFKIHDADVIAKRERQTCSHFEERHDMSRWPTRRLLAFAESKKSLERGWLVGRECRFRFRDVYRRRRRLRRARWETGLHIVLVSSSSTKVLLTLSTDDDFAVWDLPEMVWDQTTFSADEVAGIVSTGRGQKHWNESASPGEDSCSQEIIAVSWTSRGMSLGTSVRSRVFFWTKFPRPLDGSISCGEAIETASVPRITYVIQVGEALETAEKLLKLRMLYAEKLLKLPQRMLFFSAAVPVCFSSRIGHSLESKEGPLEINAIDISKRGISASRIKHFYNLACNGAVHLKHKFYVGSLVYSKSMLDLCARSDIDPIRSSTCSDLYAYLRTRIGYNVVDVVSWKPCSCLVARESLCWCHPCMRAVGGARKPESRCCDGHRTLSVVRKPELEENVLLARGQGEAAKERMKNSSVTGMKAIWHEWFLVLLKLVLSTMMFESSVCFGSVGAARHGVLRFFLKFGVAFVVNVGVMFMPISDVHAYQLRLRRKKRKREAGKDDAAAKAADDGGTASETSRKKKKNKKSKSKRNDRNDLERRKQAKEALQGIITMGSILLFVLLLVALYTYMRWRRIQSLELQRRLELEKERRVLAVAAAKGKAKAKAAEKKKAADKKAKDDKKKEKPKKPASEKDSSSEEEDSSEEEASSEEEDEPGSKASEKGGGPEKKDSAAAGEKKEAGGAKAHAKDHGAKEGGGEKKGDGAKDGAKGGGEAGGEKKDKKDHAKEEEEEESSDGPHKGGPAHTPPPPPTPRVKTPEQIQYEYEKAKQDDQECQDNTVYNSVLQRIQEEGDLAPHEGTADKKKYKVVWKESALQQKKTYKPEDEFIDDWKAMEADDEYWKKFIYVSKIDRKKMKQRAELPGLTGSMLSGGSGGGPVEGAQDGVPKELAASNRAVAMFNQMPELLELTREAASVAAADGAAAAAGGAAAGGAEDWGGDDWWNQGW